MCRRGRSFRIRASCSGTEALDHRKDGTRRSRTADAAFLFRISNLMLFSRHLREGIRRGRIRCTVRVWLRPRVKVGGRYRMDDGHVVVDSITPIDIEDVTYDLARSSGFESVDDLMRVARHGRGENLYLIRFHYLAPGAWDTSPPGRATAHGRPRRS
jgi:hypothetical protein